MKKCGGCLSNRALAAIAAFTFVFCLSLPVGAEKVVAPNNQGLVNGGPPQNGGSICDGTDGNVVANCGFENGTFGAGQPLGVTWAYSGDPTYVGVSMTPLGYSVPNSGAWAGYFGPIGNVGCISQTLDTPADFYDITAFVANIMSPNELQVWWDGNLVDDQVNMGDFFYTPMTWAANPTTSSSTVLMFCFRNDPSYIDFDDVVVTESM